MLGPIGPLASGFLKKNGFVISRPTEIEKGFTRSFWSEWFCHDPILFATTYSATRQVISKVRSWVSPESIQTSYWRYGIPPVWDASHRGSMDCTGLPDVQPEITATDLLCFIAQQINQLRYLEIGVSVGKNFLPVCDVCPDTEIVGLDLEEPSGALLEYFDHCETIWVGAEYEVDTLYGRLKKKQPSLKNLSRTGRKGTVLYLSADQFRDDTWQQIKGRNFNLVFSDGVHSPEALAAELKFLLGYNLIDRNRFAMFWDDLVGPEMQHAFIDAARQLCRLFDRTDDAIAIYKLHGSYGHQRQMGLFSSFKMK